MLQHGDAVHTMVCHPTTDSSSIAAFGCSYQPVLLKDEAMAGNLKPAAHYCAATQHNEDTTPAKHIADSKFLPDPSSHYDSCMHVALGRTFSLTHFHKSTAADWYASQQGGAARLAHSKGYCAAAVNSCYKGVRAREDLPLGTRSVLLYFNKKPSYGLDKWSHLLACLVHHAVL
jgi:hypothetical protein